MGQAGRTGGLAEGSYGNHGAYNRFKADDANAGQVYPNGNYRAEVLNGQGAESDDSVANRPEALRYRWFATDRLAEWRMRQPNYNKKNGAVKFFNTGSGTVHQAQGPRGLAKQGARGAAGGGWSAKYKNNDWTPFIMTNDARGPLITNQDAGAGDTGMFSGKNFDPSVSNRAMWSSDKPLTNAGTIGALGTRTYSRGYYGENKPDSDTAGAMGGAGGAQGDNTLTTKDIDMYRKKLDQTQNPGLGGGWNNQDNGQRQYQGIQAQVALDGASQNFKTFGQSTGTEGTFVGGSLANYKYNWDNAELSSYPRGVLENTTGQDEHGQDDDYQQDNVEDIRNDNDGTEYNGPAGGNNGSTTGAGGWDGSWNIQSLAQAITDSIMGQFREYGSNFAFSGSAGADADRRL